MASLKQEPPNEHRHTERNSVETTYLKNTYPDQERNRREERVQESVSFASKAVQLIHNNG